jgi:hypothetical protein
MRFFHLTVAASALAASLTTIGSAAADEFLGSYVARISQDDKAASDGFPLESAAQMVRQDRANWHKFGRGDAEDEDDVWFGTAASRARLEKMLQSSRAMSSATKRAITRGYPVIQVDVYRASVVVTVIGE